MNREPLIVDMSKPQESAKIMAHAPVLSSQKIGWKGLLFQEFHHPSHEIPEYVMPHHMIIVCRPQALDRENRIDGQLYHHRNWQTADSSILMVPADMTNSIVFIRSSSKF
jgi:hypothetical protein